MAYKLKFRGVSTSEATGESVNLVSAINLNALAGTDHLEIEVDFEVNSLSAISTFTFASNFCRVEVLTNGSLSVQYRNQNNFPAPVTSAAGLISVGVRYKAAFTLSNTDRNARLFLDEVQVGVAASRWGTFVIDRIGLRPSTSAFNGSLYGIKCYQNGILVNDYDPSASNGAGATLIDTTGGNNGTLVNFPVDNSQWVFYEDGGAVTSAAAFTMPQLSVAASGSVTSPNYTAAISATMPQLTVAGTASVAAPVFTSAALVLMPSFSVSASASSAAPGAGASILISMPQFAVSGSVSVSAPVYNSATAITMPQLSVAVDASFSLPAGGASVSFAMPQLSAQVGAQSTVPTYTAIISALMPQLSVLANAGASVPTGGATVSIQMPQFSVAGSATNTVPVYSITASATMPQFTVSALAGEFSFFATPSARLEAPVQSRRLEYVAKSRRLEYTKRSNRLEWRA